MKSIIMLVMGAVLTMGMSCSVKSELKDLQDLKTQCDNLEVELGGLKAKKWTPVIDNKAAQCQEHGFWRLKSVKKTKRPKDLVDDEVLSW